MFIPDISDRSGAVENAANGDGKHGVKSNINENNDGTYQETDSGNPTTTITEDKVPDDDDDTSESNSMTSISTQSF